MSQVYSTEPATTGRVVLDTTHGPVDINLWCKECPTTTRTFLQLCLDGYYDRMIFHRVLSDFLIQTGLTRDASMTGTAPGLMERYLRRSTAVPPASSSSFASGGDSLGMDRKKLELNPRIRFNHRGQVAMAMPIEWSGGKDKDGEESAMLCYQFFITLDEAPFLDAKHVCFGTIAGATMFNVLRIGRTDADERSGVPADIEDAPPRIKSVKIDFHPFDDLVVTADGTVPWKVASNGTVGTVGGKQEHQSTMEKRRKKRRGKRDLNVLSFGDEERDYEDLTSNREEGGLILSSHDVLSNESKFLSGKIDDDVDKRSKEKARIRESNRRESSRDFQGSQEIASPKKEQSLSINSAGASEARATDQIYGIQHDKGDSSKGRTNSNGHRSDKSGKQNDANIKGAVEARRAKYLKHGTGSSANKKERLKREGDTMAKLFAFKNKVLESKDYQTGAPHRERIEPADNSLASRMAKRVKQSKDEEEKRIREEEAFVALPGYSGEVNLDEDDGADSAGWLKTKFKCRRHIDQDSRTAALDGIGGDGLGGDGRRVDDYVVLDEKCMSRGERNGHSNCRHSRAQSGSHRSSRHRHYGSGQKSVRSHRSSDGPRTR